jgi:hypothetical protein
VSVDDAGGIEADNVRYAMVGSGTRPRLRVVTSNGDIGRDAFYVQQALAAGAPGVMKYDVSAAAPAQLGSEEPNRLSAYAAVVLLSTRGLERRGREALSSYVRGGGGLLMAAGPEVDGGVVADVLGRDQRLRITAEDAKATERSLVPVEVSHPVFQPFGSTLSRLGLVTFRRVAHVEGGPCRAIARFTTGEAAMLDCGAGEGHAIVLASDLDNRWNDFPLRAAFVPFVHETLRYVTDGRSPDAAMLVADVPAGVPPAPGFATVREGRGAANETRRVAVNVDPRESDLTRMSAHEFQGAVARLKSVAAADSRADARRQEDRQHLWMWALGLMIAVLVLESLVASRTA